MKNEKVSFIQNIISSLGYWFSVLDIDDHYVIKIFGIKICKRHKVNLTYKEIKTLGVTQEKRNPRIVISLTTYPARINTVHKTISTLMTQTVKADEIVLWLANEQFPDKELPENLTELQQYGLSIKWCENIMSFKKLVPSLKEYPQDIIITADDDIFYPENYIETLYSAYLENPEYIHANRAFVIKKDKKGKYLIKARNYFYNDTYLPSYKNEIMTGYGTLFPPNSLHKDVLNSDMFMKLMPTNDDCWFWGMAVKNNKKIMVNKNGYKLKLMIDQTVQADALWKKNMLTSSEGLNGKYAVNLLCETYPEIKVNLEQE